MLNLNDLKSLLYNDIKNDNEIKEELKSKETIICLYNDLLKLFDLNDINLIKSNLLSINIILDCLYDKKTIKAFNIENNIYGYINSIDEKKKEKYLNKLEKILMKIKIDFSLEFDKLENLKNRLMTIEDVITTRKIISALKYSQVITDSQIQFINNRLKRNNISYKDIIVILEKINIHNIRVKNNTESKINYTELYSLINMISQGYEYIDFSFKDNITLNDFFNNFIKTFDESDITLCSNILEGLSFYSDNDLEYLLKKILLYYQDKIFCLIEDLKNEDFYFDAEIVNIVKEEYYNYYARYMIVRNELNKLYDREIEKGENETSLVEDVRPIKLYYSSNSDNPEKCYFIKDLLIIREESLKRIEDLLEDFKKGVSNKLKPLKNTHGYSEIKDDQIRIVFKPMGEDAATILGVFIKKDDNDPLMYRKILARPIAEINDDYSIQVEDFYKKYIEENSRKGTR